MADIFKIPDKGAFTIEYARSVSKATPSIFDTFEAAKQYADLNVLGDIFIVSHGLKMNQGDESYKTSYHIDAQRIHGVWTMANE